MNFTPRNLSLIVSSSFARLEYLTLSLFILLGHWDLGHSRRSHLNYCASFPSTNFRICIQQIHFDISPGLSTCVGIHRLRYPTVQLLRSIYLTLLRHALIYFLWSMGRRIYIHRSLGSFCLTNEGGTTIVILHIVIQ